LQAKLTGEAVPPPPARKDTARVRTYKTKNETDDKKGVTGPIVLTLLFIAVVVPMLQYWGASDDTCRIWQDHSLLLKASIRHVATFNRSKDAFTAALSQAHCRGLPLPSVVPDCSVVEGASTWYLPSFEVKLGSY
jgi:hypothetical protein